MGILILICLVIFFICLIFGFGLIEIYCYFIKRNRLNKPYVVSTMVCLVIGVFSILLWMKNTSGEERLVQMILAPVMLMGFAFGGAIIGSIYNKINRTIFFKN
jgi:LytS/YehU family sensor histidine kinase